MTRLVLMTAVLATTPLWSAAQTPASPGDPETIDEHVVELEDLHIELPDLEDLQLDLPDLEDLHIEVPDLGDLNLELLEMEHLHMDLPAREAFESLIESRLAQAIPDSDRSREAVEAAVQAAAEARAEIEEARQLTFEIQMRAGDAYNAGLGALQRRQYERAIEAFDEVIEANRTRVDAALYWKAFSEFKLARTPAALSTVERLQKEHAQSRYISDAKVLEAEAREQAGQVVDPAQLNDDEIKLLAIQGLRNSEQAMPLLEGVLNGANSLNVKRRALYVLALSSDARARDILLRYAKGAGTPDLQLEAVRLLVSRRDPQTTGAVLRDLYSATTDTSVRRTVIDAYRIRSRSGPPTQSPLVSTANQDLAALYQNETNVDLRRHIAGVMAANGAMDRVVTLILNEQDTQLRSQLISSLNLRGDPQATKSLVSLYGTLTDAPSRMSIIRALAAQGNAEALIDLARAETDTQLKTHIVRHLSEMAPRSQPAADYLMEVIR